MWKMSKRPIAFVLIAIMAAGNALPAWADSVKNKSEIKHQAVGQEKGGPQSLNASFEVGVPENLDICDAAFILAVAAAALARNAAGEAALIAYDAGVAAAWGVLWLRCHLTNDPVLHAAYLADYDSTIAALDAVFAAAMALADLAFAAAVALAELLRGICKSHLYPH